MTGVQTCALPISNAAHMLCKESFVQGDPATFAAFLRKKAAVTMDPVE